MSALAALGPSPEHAKYQSLLPRYWQRVDRQEAELIERGLPAHGLGTFARTWFGAWARQDILALESCLTEDCGFIDSSSFGQLREGREQTVENCRQCFAAFPDIAFYPQDNSIRSLPYADYSEGAWRLVIPWRGVARFSGSFTLPGTDIAVAPTGRLLNFIGVDRYTMAVRETQWRISHIDTDWDMLYGAIQLAPFRVPTSVPTPLLRGALALERAVMPALRRLGT